MLFGIPVSDLSSPVLLAIAVLLLFFGYLVPRSILNEKKEEANQWREAYFAEREARIASNAQTVELLEVSKTTHAVTVAMFDTIRLAKQVGGTDALPKE